jgi:SOUL heme-binding protein
MLSRTVAAAAVALVGGAAVVVGSVARGSSVEEPVFTVESTYDGWEIRRYPPTLQAQVVVTGPYASAINEGFRVLAGYIFGGNTPGASIAMTAPVSAQRTEGQRIAMTAPVGATSAGEEAWTVAFTMPSSWSLETLPAPLDPRVRLVAVEGARVAARRFGGWATVGRVAEQQEALLAALRGAGLAAGTPTVAQYNPPWPLPPLRRNEILVPVTDG